VRLKSMELRPDDQFHFGDKVRVRVGIAAGARGEVVLVNKRCVTVIFVNGTVANVPMSSLTNFSLAARRAERARNGASSRLDVTHKRPPRPDLN
jgi:ribosomal protein L24